MSSPLEIQKEAENKILRMLEDMNMLEKNLIYRQLNRADHLSIDGIDSRIEKYARELSNRADSMALEFQDTANVNVVVFCPCCNYPECGHDHSQPETTKPQVPNSIFSHPLVPFMKFDKETIEYFEKWLSAENDSISELSAKGILLLSYPTK